MRTQTLSMPRIGNEIASMLWSEIEIDTADPSRTDDDVNDRVTKMSSTADSKIHAPRRPPGHPSLDHGKNDVHRYAHGRDDSECRKNQGDTQV